MVWEGRDACKTGRCAWRANILVPSPSMLTSSLAILGATNPLESNPGTIRGDYAIDVGRNVCHGSDGVESAKKEIALWFNKDEILSWKHAQAEWIYEKP